MPDFATQTDRFQEIIERDKSVSLTFGPVSAGILQVIIAATTVDRSILRLAAASGNTSPNSPRSSQHSDASADD